jgi:hypothetical protein
VELAATPVAVELVQLQTSNQAAAAARLLPQRQAASQRQTVSITHHLHSTALQSRTLVHITPETVQLL